MEVEVARHGGFDVIMLLWDAKQYLDRLIVESSIDSVDLLQFPDRVAALAFIGHRPPPAYLLLQKCISPMFR